MLRLMDKMTHPLNERRREPCAFSLHQQEGSLIIKRTPGRRKDERGSTGETHVCVFFHVIRGSKATDRLDLDEIF